MSGRIVRRIATIIGIDHPWSLSVTPDGRHIVLSAPADPGHINYRVDDGRIGTLPTHLDRLVW
jgi:hypothetical protein